jgi:hypothetical protein
VCPLIKVKAEELGKLLNDEEFMLSAGWIERFRSCHSILCGEVSGEARAVNCETEAEWPQYLLARTARKVP